MVDIRLIPQDEFRRVRSAALDAFERHALVADMCRANALAAVKCAGSGHLGSSLSAMDIVVWLYEAVLNTLEVGLDAPDRDVYFSSKGHDVPGLYAVLHSFGVLPDVKLLKLRRLGGLDGHPDVGVPGVETNSGSLGMGVSKGRGMAWARRQRGSGGRVFVMTGDGELQEGQIYEALQAAAHQRVANLHVIVDHNKVQSDKPVAEILDLGDLEAKLGSFGWQVARCDGHDLKQLAGVLDDFAKDGERPKLLIADTIKGRGVSFMEHPQALREGKGLYGWHAGAPDDAAFHSAHEEVVKRANERLAASGLAALRLELAAAEAAAPAPTLVVQNALGEPVSLGVRDRHASRVTDEYVAEAYGQALLDIAPRRPDLVVLDADLAADCRTRAFEKAHPTRFIQNGIAEQDMVSMAGGLARSGLLPVVNSFASFLCSRANEQIYNNASEGTKIIYACHYAGLIPAGPGKSHQSIRDISLLGALPNLEILQPCNAEETRMAMDYAVDVARDSCALRLVIGPSPRRIELPADYALRKGRGAVLREGDDAVLIAYGPVMLHEALLAAEILRDQRFALRVVGMPWLNRFDGEWLMETLGNDLPVYVLEDHAPVGGLGDGLRRALADAASLAGRGLEVIAVEGYPACGTPPEALRFHGLDGASLAARILTAASRSA